MKQKILNALKTNYLIFAFWAVSLIIELTAVTVTGGKFFIRKPYIYLSIMLVFTSVMYSVKNQNGRFWFAFALLAFQFAVDLVFIIIFEMTDTIFDFSMLNLRKDGMAIIESIPINFVYVLVSGIMLSAYVLFGRYFIRRVPKPPKPAKLPLALTAAAMACTLILHGVFAYVSHRNYDPSNTVTKLHRTDTSSYADKGIMGNFIDELYKGAFFSKVKLGDTDELENFVYSQISTQTDMFGIAKNYNVVTVLGESFEWFSFIADAAKFPGGFDASEETLRQLYPNLYELYDSAVVMDNFHAREKTDISENLSIIGAYPTDKFTNYDYPKNTVVTSLARTLKAFDSSVAANSFHNGTASFYNRNEYLTHGLGFDSFKAADDMTKMGMPDYLWNGERNLDSDMIKTCAESMFPTDRRFYTYITTITQHGQYEPRENLKKYYDKLDAYGVASLPDEHDKNYNVKKAFRTYVAAAMELDAAIGEINSELNKRGLADNTVLVLFGDHNAYYSSLSGEVKGITDGKYDSENYTGLYRVPFMVRIGNGNDFKKGGKFENRRIINKFTCTADILPTLYDLLGIKTFSNLLYGHSVFEDTESVLYSRAYDVFVTDKVYFSSLNKIRYKAQDADEAYMERTEKEAVLLMQKVSHTNRIFYYDYLSGEKESAYYEKLKSIQ